MRRENVRRNLVERIGYKKPERKGEIHGRLKRAKKFAAMLEQGGEGGADMHVSGEREALCRRDQRHAEKYQK